MPKTINQIQDEIVAEFKSLTNWDDKYALIIKQGKALNAIEPQYQTEEYEVKGCQSTVWMHAENKTNGTILFHADSDALIVRGLIALLLRVYSNQSAQAIVDTAPNFLDRIEMSHHLSMQRSNGLAAMIKQMKLYAQVFTIQAKLS